MLLVYGWGDIDFVIIPPNWCHFYPYPWEHIWQLDYTLFSLAVWNTSSIHNSWKQLLWRATIYIFSHIQTNSTQLFVKMQFKLLYGTHVPMGICTISRKTGISLCNQETHVRPFGCKLAHLIPYSSWSIDLEAVLCYSKFLKSPVWKISSLLLVVHVTKEQRPATACYNMHGNQN